MKLKKHLTSDGLLEIKSIMQSMNNREKQTFLLSTIEV